MASASSNTPLRVVPSVTPAIRNSIPALQLGFESVVPLAAQLDAFIGDPNFMTSLARGLLVIQAFSQRKLNFSISQISKRTGLSRASVRRCLHTLSKLGFAGTDDGRNFHLCPRVLALGHSYLSSMPLATAAQPMLEHLSHILHESFSIAVLDGPEVVYIARTSMPRIFATDLGVGTRLPAFCTSMGRVLMANLSPEELESVIPRMDFARYSDRTTISQEKLRRVLVAAQRDGYAIVDQEMESGLRSMAVPVRNPMGRVVAAIDVETRGHNVSAQHMQTRFLPYLRAAAQELSTLLR
jgi:IclR family pca regulon transcriptional regulator